MPSRFFLFSLALFTATSSDAAQARPRVVIEAKSSPLSSAVQLAVPRPLSDVAGESASTGKLLLGIDFEAKENGDEIADVFRTVDQYVSYRRKPGGKRSSARKGSSAAPEFCAKTESETARFFCAFERLLLRKRSLARSLCFSKRSRRARSSKWLQSRVRAWRRLRDCERPAWH